MSSLGKLPIKTEEKMDIKKYLIPPFSQWLFNNEWSDASIAVNGKKIPIHKIIIAAKSPVLRQVFTTKDLIEIKVCEIKYTNPFEIVRSFLQYVYTESYHYENLSEVLSLLLLAKKYKVDKLCEQIATDLAKWLASPDFISENNFFDVKELASEIGFMDHNIIARIELFGIVNKIDILRYELTEYVSLDRIKKIMGYLSADQKDVIKALSIGGVIASSGRDLKDFECLIDLNKCSLTELPQLEQLNLFRTSNLRGVLLKKLGELANLFG